MENIILIITFVILPMILIIVGGIQAHSENKKLNDKYNVDKFPVTSEKGNKYYVEIKRNQKDHYSYEPNCYIYKRIYNKKLKPKDKLIYSKSVNLDDLDYDYILIASSTIKEYEEDKEKERLRIIEMENKITKNKELFKGWDGKC